jgi:pimeloyl-ACP methyl ester carboxylesterase
VCDIISISISEYLTARLPEFGARHIFGVPEKFDDVNLRICIAKHIRTEGLARFAIIATILCVAVLSSIPKSQAQESEVKNIVLVHGAWADGSGWRGVYDILVKDGFNVSIVQEPETSFQGDVAATRRILASQNGHCILVAHSYGGSGNYGGGDGSVSCRVGVRCSAHA